VAGLEAMERLLDVRRERERHAEEAVVRCLAAAERAARHTRAAADAIAEHAARSTAAEQGAFTNLVGQAVSAASLNRMRGSIEQATWEAARLQEVLRSAKAAEEACLEELEAARRNHLMQLKERAKLEEIVAALRGKAARRQLALAEAVEEENHGSVVTSAARK